MVDTITDASSETGPVEPDSIENFEHVSQASDQIVQDNVHDDVNVQNEQDDDPNAEGIEPDQPAQVVAQPNAEGIEPEQPVEVVQQHAEGMGPEPPAEVVEPVRDDVPWDVLFPRKSRFRDAIVDNALPPLLGLLRDPSNRLRPARDLVNEALEKCAADGKTFWGKYDVYTRKRSAADALLTLYFNVLNDYAAGRAVAPL